MPLLVSPAELAELLASAAPPRLLDVRWTLAVPDGRPAYRAGHLPGAVYVDLDTELARHGAPTDGRHPLPTPADLQAAARRWGLREGDTVVVYDDGGNLAAARAWWLLRNAGLSDVRILDGALAAWRTAGLPLATGDEVPEPGDITLQDGALPVLDLDGAAAYPEGGVLLDVRAAERYRGETEPIDPRAGHIPGAVNAPTGENLDADGRFLDVEALRRRFGALGLQPGDEVGVYCGSGVTASHTAAALTLAGYRPALFPGSWSQWSNQSDRPVAVGPTPHTPAPRTP
ncbi:sulfurtransferase, partial [uncultured Friedmanniella sp.]|uniref:sulfurtransferase n=1 Tax=uncultured Friedmanniella sp. TaxID=335381 RepID=UPI0035C95499